MEPDGGVGGEGWAAVSCGYGYDDTVSAFCFGGGADAGGGGVGHGEGVVGVVVGEEALAAEGDHVGLGGEPVVDDGEVLLEAARVDGVGLAEALDGDGRVAAGPGQLGALQVFGDEFGELDVAQAPEGIVFGAG